MQTAVRNDFSSLPSAVCHLPTAEKNSPRKAAGGSKAHARFWLWLLPFGPDPVPSRTLHRSRPLSTARLEFFENRNCINIVGAFHRTARLLWFRAVRLRKTDVSTVPFRCT